nr:hypothetical protein [uncultured archaeon]
MVKRTKRLEKGIESIKEEIEEHFLKLSEDIINKNKYLAGYHTKEIELSLMDALQEKIAQLGKSEEYSYLLEEYKSLLEEYKEKINKLEE